MPARNHDSERTCIVTRETAPVDALIRFVVAPDGALVPDLKRKLPGRGLWVKATADCIETAERKKLFARAHRGPVHVESGLAARVEAALAESAVQALSMARKAGSVVSGFAKVEGALAKGGVIALIHAAEAAPDGIAKLAGAARRREAGVKPAIIRCFTAEQLGLAFGGANVIHAAILAGPASRNLMLRVERWLAYRGDDTRPDGRHPDRAETKSDETASSGPRNE